MFNKLMKTKKMFYFINVHESLSVKSNFCLRLIGGHKLPLLVSYISFAAAVQHYRRFSTFEVHPYFIFI